MKYQEIKNQEPILEKCFFAFSNQQFTEGKEKAEITDEQIFDGGAGLYGTKEGLEKLRNYYTEREKKIAVECTPQEVYDYEYSNHECSYVGDDEEAILIVISIFGIQLAKNVVRKFAYYQLN